jgi:hypothetical protein
MNGTAVGAVVAVSVGRLVPAAAAMLLAAAAVSKDAALTTIAVSSAAIVNAIFGVEVGGVALPVGTL